VATRWPLSSRAAGFVLIPVYAHVLPAADFGAYAMIVMLADIPAVAFGTVLSQPLDFVLVP
jgi:O-antigen/teichoic acid export membrane protein